jgi:hypothetical protein
MSYRQLRTFLNEHLSEEQLDQTVTVNDGDDEYWSVLLIEALPQNDVLDEGHFFFIEGPDPTEYD